MKVLVTGANGFLGSSLVRHLISAGYSSRVLLRKESNQSSLEGLKVERIEGDIIYPGDADRAVAGCSVVFHLASLYKFYPWWQRKPEEIYKVNVEGTKNILESAFRHKVKRFIFTSSVASILPDSSPKVSHYARSKMMAEDEVMKFHKKGLPVIILNPAALIGERDYKPTPTGQMIVNFLNRAYPGYFNGLISLADVGDVSRAHLAALKKGRFGERYVLCNNRAYSLKELFDLVEQISGIKGPGRRISYPLMISFLYFNEIAAYFLKCRPLLSVQAARFFRRSITFDSSKAAKELGYAATPIVTSLEKAVNWYKENGYVH